MKKMMNISIGQINSIMNKSDFAYQLNHLKKSYIQIFMQLNKEWIEESWQLEDIRYK